MFNFHVQWCQKGCSRSVAMSKWAINFKNKPDPSTQKLSWRQQPFRTTFQIYKPSFIPQEVTIKKYSIFVWQIPGGSLMCMLAVLLHEPYREVQHYNNSNTKAVNDLKSLVISSGLMLSRFWGNLWFWKLNSSSDSPTLGQHNKWINASHTQARDLRVKYCASHQIQFFAFCSTWETVRSL